jgi:hypothetical protein
MRIIFVGREVFLTVICCVFLSFAVVACSNWLWAADKQLLSTKHANKGVTCNNCHKEISSKSLVPTETCLKCHGGNYEALAEKTKKVDPNPHASHKGDLGCESCHHVHKESVDRCGACHDYNFKVP